MPGVCSSGSVCGPRLAILIWSVSRLVVQGLGRVRNQWISDHSGTTQAWIRWLNMQGWASSSHQSTFFSLWWCVVYVVCVPRPAISVQCVSRFMGQSLGRVRDQWLPGRAHKCNQHLPTQDKSTKNIFQCTHKHYKLTGTKYTKYNLHYKVILTLSR